jgi:transcriptional regulator with XRE-family HTH domain
VPLRGEKASQLARLGANVRRERTNKGFTQEQLAEKIEISLRNVQRIEAGEINPLTTTLVRLRQALGCSADKLLPRS